tara:strand:+ start:677 stop:904 length:228 start_codon:yes stop_codon:yes gene_type:complete
MINTILHSVIQAHFFNIAGFTNFLRDFDSQPIAGEKYLRWFVSTISFRHPFDIHVYLRYYIDELREEKVPVNKKK